MKKMMFLLLAAGTQFISLQAETYQLDLNKSIEIAKEKSFSMLNMQKDLKIAEYNLKEVKSKMKTHINLNFTLPEYNQRITEFRTDNSIKYYTNKTLDYKGGIQINQPLPTDGYLFLNSNLGNRNDYNLNTAIPSLNTTIGYSQPLQSIYGYNKIKASLKVAQLNFERSKKSLIREELNLVYQVSSSFFNLLSQQKGVEIAKSNFDRQKEAYEISQNKYNAGLIKEVDALQMEVDLAEAQNNYDLANVGLVGAQNEFKQLIGLNLNDDVIISSEFKYLAVVVDPEKAVGLAKENRVEIREQEISIEQNKLRLRSEKANGMIQSSLDVSYGNYGVYNNNLPINSKVSTALDNVFNSFLHSPGFGVGLTVKVPLVDFGENRARVNAAKTTLEQTILRKGEVERDIEREVRNLVAKLNNNLKRLQLLEKNIRIAEKSFEITRQRYADGDIDSQALALERNRLNTAYTSHLSAYTSYQLALADLMRKTFFDFQNNKSIL